jgi:hypothetical protein
MVPVAVGDRQWYAAFLLLSDHGAVPGLPSGRIRATKSDCIRAYGSPLLLAGIHTCTEVVGSILCMCRSYMSVAISWNQRT